MNCEILEEVIKTLNDKTNNYNKILSKFKILSSELNLSNSLELSTLFTYMLWNGYFSKDKKLYYQIGNNTRIYNMFSYNIMNGHGVCLDFAHMLKDALKECGHDSVILINKIPQIGSALNYIPDIKRNYKNTEQRNYIPDSFSIELEKTDLTIKKTIFAFLMNNKKRCPWNHVFNLIEENDKFYIYDSTNLNFLELKNKKTAKNFTGTGSAELFPLYSCIFALKNQKELDILKTFLGTKKFLSPYTETEYITTSEKCIELCKNNKKLFDDYHSDINEDILQISEAINFSKEKVLTLKR